MMGTEVLVAAGVWAGACEKGRWINLKEVKPAGKPSHLGLSIDYPGTCGLTPEAARKLADQLYDFAARAEERNK